MTDIITTIETDLAEAGDWLEKEFEGVATSLWNIVKAVWEELEPAEYQILLSLLQSVLTNLGKGATTADILQSVKEQAQTAGHDFVGSMSEEILVSIIAAVKAKEGITSGLGA